VEEYKNITTGIPYNPDTLNGIYKTIFMMIKTALPGKTVGNYSGNWVINKYIPKFWMWAKDYPYWNAFYVKYFYWWWSFISSLGGKWDSDLLTISIANLRRIMEKIAANPVPDPLGMEGKVTAWQCITFIPFTELTYWQRRMDWNITSDDGYKVIFGDAVVPEVVPEVVYPQYRCTALWGLRIRSTPSLSGTIIGGLSYGQVVTVYEIVDGWRRIGTGQWVSMTYLEGV